MLFFLLKTTNERLTVQIFFNLQNHPIFYSEERLVNLIIRKECFVGLSILLFYAFALETEYLYTLSL